MTKTGFEFWSLLFVWYLRFVIWNFYSPNTPWMVMEGGVCIASLSLQIEK